MISPTTVTVTIFSTPTESATPKCEASGFETFLIMIGWLVGAPLMFFGTVGLIALGAGALGYTGKFLGDAWCMWRNNKKERREERRKLAEDERQRRDLERAERAPSGSGRRYEEVRGEKDNSLLTLVEREGKWTRMKSWFGSWGGRRALGEKNQTKTVEEGKEYERPKDVDSDTEVDSLTDGAQMG